MSVLVLSQQEAVPCVRCIQKVTVVKHSCCLRAAEIENIALSQLGKVKFCQKLGKSASETFQMIKQVYGEKALGRSAVFKLHKCFAQGRQFGR